MLFAFTCAYAGVNLTGSPRTKEKPGDRKYAYEPADDTKMSESETEQIRNVAVRPTNGVCVNDARGQNR